MLWFAALSWTSSTIAAQSYPLQNLRPGLMGYGITAGPGNMLERFPIEVLALQHEVGLGFPVVLVRASGEFIERSGGVAAGMSGSPVYLPLGGDDLLLGAIGFTFPDSESGLALVTPIEIMRRAVPLRVEAFGQESFAGLGAPVPVRTPLLLSGLSERASGQLEGLFSQGRVQPLPIQVGGAFGMQDEQFDLQPGSAVSVQLVRGDITIAAVGTVTLIEDGSFWAFGHPLLGQGDVSYALAPAYVSYIVPNRVTPFKLADSGQRLLGSVTQDRPYAVSGLLDQPPSFIPVTLTLHSGEASITKRFEITADERYYAPLLAAATLQAFDELTQGVTSGTTELAWEITLAGNETVRILEQITDPHDIAQGTAALAAEPLAILARNEFADPEVARVNLTISFSNRQRVADIVEVIAHNESLQPGGTLIAYIRLQPYRAEPDVKTVSIPLPPDLAGPVTLTFRGGLEPSEGEHEGDMPILSFDELLIALRGHEQSSELIVEVPVEGKTTRLERLPLPYLVRGTQTLDVRVGEVLDEVHPAEMPYDEPNDGTASGRLLDSESTVPEPPLKDPPVHREPN